MINSYTSWQPLEEVIVGRAYTPDYFDYIADSQVREQLQKILAETAEDLDNLQRTIEQYGARVRRPNLVKKSWFWEQQQIGNPIPTPPLITSAPVDIEFDILFEPIYVFPFILALPMTDSAKLFKEG